MARAKSIVYQYIPKMDQRENNLFLEEYYSSTDTQIYFDDIYQTEIAYISYSVQEQIKPLYGYSSRTYDEVAIGSRIVTGVFKVPIKNKRYNTKFASYEEILNENDYRYDLLNDIDEYNLTEEQERLAHEWIYSGNRKVAEKKIEELVNNLKRNTFDQNLYDYLNKMILLEFKDADGSLIKRISTEEQIKQGIQRFQEEYKIDDTTGELTVLTMNKIDSLVNAKNGKNINISTPKDTKMYLSMSQDAPFSTTDRAQNGIIIDKTDDGWVQIRLNSGVIGWVKKEDLK